MFELEFILAQKTSLQFFPIFCDYWTENLWKKIINLMIYMPIHTDSETIWFRYRLKSWCYFFLLLICPCEKSEMIIWFRKLILKDDPNFPLTWLLCPLLILNHCSLLYHHRAPRNKMNKIKDKTDFIYSNIWHLPSTFLVKYFHVPT